MEAPEKLYISKRKDYSDERWLVAFFEREFREDIEYTRTDAFIEKALTFIRENFHKHAYEDFDIAKGVEVISLSEDFIEDFKKYMKR